MQGDIRLTPFYNPEACVEKIKGYVESLNNGIYTPSLVPRPSARRGGGRKAWYTLHVHAR